jgi:hypothetical protein
MQIFNQFEQFLTNNEARKYYVNRFPIKKIWNEVSGEDHQLFAILGKDMIHFEELRAKICKALSDKSEEQKQKAAHWKFFLKARLEVLELWLSSTVAFGTYLPAALALLSLIAPPGGPTNFFAICAALIAMAFPFFRLELDRHKCWYKYLIVHLEAIEKMPHKQAFMPS